jgi:ferredoxin
MLSQKSTHFLGREIAMLQLCADTSDLSAKMMIAEMPFHNQSCELCFEICDACAVECEKYPEDPEMLRCADICRQCAESCRGMAGMTVHMKMDTGAQQARVRQ